jgi:hypothetical protein
MFFLDSGCNFGSRRNNGTTRDDFQHTEPRPLASYTITMRSLFIYCDHMYILFLTSHLRI